jgi:transposase-like protein
MRGSRIAVTSDIVDKLVQAVLVGATYELAAKYAGISKDTFDRWRKQAEHAKPGTPLAELRTRLRQAEGRAAVGWLALVNQAAQVDWKAASWLLAHRYPELYGGGLTKVAFTDATGEQEGTLTLNVIYEDAIDVTPELPVVQPRRALPGAGQGSRNGTGQPQG